jgi:predicted nucleic acid-binding Zn ribbon protein
MTAYTYFCKSCSEPYEVKMSAKEKETWVPRCPNCGGDEAKQEILGVSSDNAGKGHGGCCGSRGCCGG